VRIEEKHIEKLRYIHRNPVKRGLAEKAGAVTIKPMPPT
jgi:hypothetical protein